MSAFAYGKKLQPQFVTRLLEMCKRLNWSFDHANWLIACMAFETRNTFSPQIKNPKSSATGLIQFMDETAARLGTSTAALAKMTAIEQLNYVEKYFKPYHKNIHSLEDMYMAILWPKAIGSPNDAILWRAGTKQYRVNKGLDRKNVGYVTKAMAAALVRERLERGLHSDLAVITEDDKPVKYFSLFNALKKGVALRHAATWQNVSVATALLTSVLTALLTFATTGGWLPVGFIDEQTIAAASGAIVSVVTLGLGYLGIATNENKGI